MKTCLRRILVLLAAGLLVTAGPAVAETRNWTNASGKTITAELVRLDGDKAVLAMGGREYPIPVATLSQADQDFIKEWQSQMEAEEAAATAEAEAARPKLLAALDGEMVMLDGREVEAFAIEDESKIRYMAFYSSASWCGPCQAFSPELVRSYKSLKRRYDNFELLLLTADRSEEDWVEYMKEHKMPYPSVKYGSSAKGAASQGRNTRGIPSIHVIDVTDGSVPIDGSAGASASLEALEDLLKESQR